LISADTGMLEHATDRMGGERHRQDADLLHQIRVLQRRK